MSHSKRKDSKGMPKAEDLVKKAAEELNLRLDSLSPADALRIMEKIANQPGIAGITARFAKSRIHLWEGDAAKKRQGS